MQGVVAGQESVATQLQRVSSRCETECCISLHVLVVSDVGECEEHSSFCGVLTGSFQLLILVPVVL